VLFVTVYAPVYGVCRHLFVSDKVVGYIHKQNTKQEAQLLRLDTAMSAEILSSAAQLYAKLALEKACKR